MILSRKLIIIRTKYSIISPATFPFKNYLLIFTFVCAIIALDSFLYLITTLTFLMTFVSDELMVRSANSQLTNEYKEFSFIKPYR